MLLVGSSTDVQLPDRSASFTTTERLFSAPIQLTFDDVQLDIRIARCSTSREAGKGLALSLNDNDVPEFRHLDLTGSVYNVAEGYVQDSLDLLAQDIGQEEIPGISEKDPFSLPGAFETSSSSNSRINQTESIGLIAQIIERLLARLQLSIESLKIRLFIGESQEEPQMELRLAKLGSRTDIQDNGTVISCTRSLDLHELGIWLREPESISQRPYSASRKASSNSDNSRPASQESTDSADDMMMSMAIADLRTSRTEPSRDSMYFSTDAEGIYPGQQSVYHDLPQAPEPSAEKSETPDAATSEQNVPSMSVEEPAWSQIFALSRSTKVKEQQTSADAGIRFTTLVASATSANTSTSSYQLDFELSTLGLRLDSKQIKFLLTLASVLQLLDPDTYIGSSKPLQPVNPVFSPSNLLTHVRLQAFRTFLPLEETSLTLQEYIASPPPSTPTLFVAIYSLEAAYRSTTFEGKVALRDYSVFMSSPDTHHKAAIQPLILPDPGLAYGYSSSALVPGESISRTDEWVMASSGRGGNKDGDQTLDSWKTSMSPDASSDNAANRLPILKDAVAIRVQKNSINLILQPVHNWIDLELLGRFDEIISTLSIIGRMAKSGEDVVGKREPEIITPLYNVTISVTCVRLDLRCPSPVDNTVRAGVWTLDLHDLKVCHTSQPGSQHATKRSRARAATFETLKDDSKAVEPEIARIELGRAFVFHCRNTRQKNGHQSLCILAIGPEAQTKTHTVMRLVRKDRLAGSSTFQGLCNIPSVHAHLIKSTLDGLQYLADDLAQTSAKLGSKNSDSKYGNHSNQSGSPESIQKSRERDSSTNTSQSSSSEESSNTGQTAIVGADVRIGRSKYAFL